MQPVNVQFFLCITQSKQLFLIIVIVFVPVILQRAARVSTLITQNIPQRKPRK